MKETNASETMGALLYDWNQWQKSILLEVQNLKKLDNEWASSTAKVGKCKTPYTEMVFTDIYTYTIYLSIHYT